MIICLSVAQCVLVENTNYYINVLKINSSSKHFIVLHKFLVICLNMHVHMLLFFSFPIIFIMPFSITGVFSTYKPLNRQCIDYVAWDYKKGIQPVKTCCNNSQGFCRPNLNSKVSWLVTKISTSWSLSVRNKFCNWHRLIAEIDNSLIFSCCVLRCAKLAVICQFLSADHNIVSHRILLGLQVTTCNEAHIQFLMNVSHCH